MEQLSTIREATTVETSRKPTSSALNSQATWLQSETNACIIWARIDLINITDTSQVLVKTDQQTDERTASSIASLIFILWPSMCATSKRATGWCRRCCRRKRLTFLSGKCNLTIQCNFCRTRSHCGLQRRSWKRHWPATEIRHLHKINSILHVRPGDKLWKCARLSAHSLSTSNLSRSNNKVDQAAALGN